MWPTPINLCTCLSAALQLWDCIRAICSLRLLRLLWFFFIITKALLNQVSPIEITKSLFQRSPGQNSSITVFQTTYMWTLKAQNKTYSIISPCHIPKTDRRKRIELRKRYLNALIGIRLSNCYSVFKWFKAAGAENECSYSVRTLETDCKRDSLECVQ